MAQVSYTSTVTLIAVVIFGSVGCGVGFRSYQNLERIGGLFDSQSYLRTLGTCEGPQSELLPPVVSRLTISEYRNVAIDMFGGVSEGIDGALRGMNKNLTFNNYENNSEFSPYPQFISQTRDLALAFASQGGKFLMDNRNQLCSTDSVCLNTIGKKWLPRLWRTAPSDQNQQQISELFVGIRTLYGDSNAEEGLKRAIERTLEFLFVSPYFHFKLYKARSQEFLVAEKLSFFLLGSVPDQTLIDVAMSGRLSQRGVYMAQAERLLGLSLVSERLGEGLGGGWLQYKGRIDDDTIYTDVPISDHAKKIKGRFIASLSSNEDIGQFFSEKNNGFLYSPFFYQNMSVAEASDSSPVRRGVFAMENLLCLKLPDLDQATIGEIEEIEAEIRDKNLSKIEALEYHRSNPNCASCHISIDNYGLGFENLDPFGNWRTKYPDGSQVHSVGQVGQRGYTDSHQYFQLLTNLPAFKACVMKNVLAYAKRINVKAANPCFVKQNYQAVSNIRDVVLRVVNSPHFLSEGIKE